jgi:two-component system, NtrC family, response regulator AtoC
MRGASAVGSVDPVAHARLGLAHRVGPSESAPTIIADEDQPAGPMQVIVVGKGGLTTHRLPATGSVVLGRGPESDLRLDDARVSRSHARLRGGSEPAIQDLGSANGTRLRGQRLDKDVWTPLALGEGVQIGSHTLFVQRAGSADDLPVVTADDPGPEEPASEQMRALYRTVARVARGTINVLILGETGVGKDVLAQHLHQCSGREDKPFVRVECATLSETLLVSDLFGHERGAFTGAVQSKPGLLETAEGGTVFLDEVGELPLPIQAKLLHALETRQVLRAGSVKSRQIDVRYVAATNRDLNADVAEGRFRRDLFFRLSAFTAIVPPLRQRMAEVVPLARQFAVEAARPLGRAAPALSEPAAAVLMKHDWPGNIRELRNVIELAVLLSEGELIEAQHISLDPQAAAAPAPTVAAPAAGGDPDQEERQRILRVLAECGGNQTKAARQLGMARGTLLARLDAYGVPRPRMPLGR